MTPDPEAAEIAAKLSPTERAALMTLSMTRFTKPPGNLKKRGQSLGMLKVRGLAFQDGSDYAVSDLGLRVRAILAAEDGPPHGQTQNAVDAANGTFRSHEAPENGESGGIPGAGGDR